MTNRFMISVAVLALVAGTGFANAQGAKHESGSTGSQQMQHAQPSGDTAERGGAMNKDSAGKEKGTVGQAGGSNSMKSGSDEKSSGAMRSDDKSSGAMNKNQASEDKAGASKDQRTEGQQDKSKGMSSENQSKTGKDTKAEGNEGRTNDNMKAEGNRNGTNNAETRDNGQRNNMNAEGRNGTNATVGQAGAGAKLTTEQRTQITSVIREERVRPVTNVNFAVSVGTRIPREGIELHALPSRVVTIYPEWRSYKYVLVRDEIVIIDPNTYEIVAVLNV